MSRHLVRRGLIHQLNCQIAFFMVIVFLLTIASCRGYRTLEGRAKPVYLTADFSIFKDTLYPLQPVRFRVLADLKGAEIETAELKEGVTSKVFIHSPTFFRTMYSEFFVYPGEHITVKGEYDNVTFLAGNGNKQRNRELLFFKTFQQLQKYPSVPTSVPNATLDIILNVEKQQKDRIRKAEAASQITFDSLSKAYDVSKKFKRLTYGYIKHKYEISLNWIYKLHRDTLMAHGLYFEKLRQFIPVINGITKKLDFNANVREVLNDRVPDLFAGNRMVSFDEVGFKACFDSVENNFTGFARDYLLSRIMYRAYAKGMKVPADYKEKYNRYSTDKAYRKIVKNTRKERELNDKDNKGGPNQLLAADGKLQISLEDLLARYRGKFVLMDLWASWCGPCIKEMPHWQHLIEKYALDKIIFLTVSIDNQTFSWRDAIIKQNIQAWNNYLLIDAAKTSFYKKNNISTIPRYLLFDREGKVMNADAPSPSEPALNELLNKLVLN